MTVDLRCTSVRIRRSGVSPRHALIPLAAIRSFGAKCERLEFRRDILVPARILVLIEEALIAPGRIGEGRSPFGTGDFIEVNGQIGIQLIRPLDLVSRELAL
jgi:hypothetical protein